MKHCQVNISLWQYVDPDQQIDCMPFKKMYDKINGSKQKSVFDRTEWNRIYVEKSQTAK